MASGSRARAGVPAHVIRYNPKFSLIADYLIAFQGGMLLRAVACPPGSSYDLRGTEAGRSQSSRLIADHLRAGGLTLPPANVEGLCGQLYDGLMLQLRSMPISLRVDAWLRAEYPALGGQQEEAARAQLAENQQALKPETARIAPPLLRNASLGMSAAFSGFWAKTLGDPSISFPYRASGHLDVGDRLLQIADGLPNGPANDKALIRAWGDHLGIGAWFDLSPA